MSQAVICPSVTAYNTHQYREQVERIAAFAHRVHLDFMDGLLAPTKSPSLEQIWWPVGVKADIHLMYKNPEAYLNQIIKLEPHMLIIHAEADGDFDAISRKLKATGIKTGVALLPGTPASLLKDYIDVIDHVLIFSGNLGHFGGKADLSLLGKASQLKAFKPNIEVGWDGGINAENAKTFINNGIDVLNVGGFIQNSKLPQEAYATLEAIAEAAGNP